MTDIWVCANCRSVNNLRAKQCYQCRTPKDRAAVDPSEIDGTTKGKLREIELPDFQPSREFAILAMVAIIALAVVQALNSILSVDEVIETVDEFGFAVVTIDTVSPLALPTYVLAGAALVAFAFWLSRTVGSMPALGLGYPAATATTAFLEVFIPGLNLMRIPAILRDVIRRLEPQEGRGDVLIYAAWIGLFGGILLPRIGLYLGLFSANTSDSGAQALVVVRLFSTLLVMGGAIFLVALIWWIEGRIARRREQQLAGVPAPSLPTDVPPGAAAGLRDIPVDPSFSFRQPAAPRASDAQSGHASAAPSAVASGAGAAPRMPTPATATASVGQTVADGPPATDPSLAPASDAFSASEAPAGTPAAEPTVVPSPAIAPGAPAVTLATDAPTTPPAHAPTLAPAATPAPAPGSSSFARPITAAAGHAHLPSDDAPLAATQGTVSDEPAPAPSTPAAQRTQATASTPATLAPRPDAGLTSSAAPAADPAAGPHLRIEVGPDGGILASVDGSEPEPATLDELREAAMALAEAGGSVAVVNGAGGGAGLDTAAQIVTTFEDAGVRTTVEPPA